MVFTTEQVAFILMAHFRSGTRNPDGTWSYSLESCVDQFIKAFPNEIVDYEVFGNHKRRIVSRFENKNCICREKSSGRPTVLQQPVLEDIQARMRASPQNSIRKLAAQTGLSFSSCRKALVKNLHMHAYRVSVVQELHPVDFEKRVLYCQWFNEHLRNDDVLDLTFYG
ncbi:hypothetical protein ABEB36_000086 [Hypothenemus hampei]|uniref:Uncharacterized protein n=1 Tax=Hypothenemus hampei TaxID=57062 RepID=A0ABD1FAP7_HYPHA